VESFIKSPKAQAGVAEGISNVTGIPAEYIDVDLSAEPEKRRLRAQQLAKANALMVTYYAIAVDGAAPSSITSTGEEVAIKLAATNDVKIGQAITTKVEEAMVGPAKLSSQTGPNAATTWV